MPLSRKPFSPSSPSPSNGTNQNDGVAKTGNSVPARRLTRQRKLRHLSDQDIGSLYSTDSSPSSSSPSFQGSPEPSLKSRSLGCSDHRSSSASPQPLPLPESPLTRRPGSTRPDLFAHRSFPLPRKTEDHDGMVNTKPSHNLGKSSLDSNLANSKYNLRVHIPAARFLTVVNVGNSSYKDPRIVSHDNDDSESIPNLSLGVAAKSAPTSAVTTPVTSPRRSSNVDFLDPTANFPLEVNDNVKMLPAKTFHSPDHSPPHCPLILARFINPKTQEGSQHPKFLSSMWPENNHVDAHPLPLPLRASPPAQLPMLHQPSTMPHAMENLPSVKGRWQKGKLIGRGTFGSVFHATNLETGASCAMKEVDLIPDDPTSVECMKQLEQEIRILRQLRHPNIVQYYGSEIVGNHLYIYMEYVHPGSINKFIHEHCEAMTESVVRNFTRHILSGLAYLHSTKTIHRDIKGANLLVNESGIVKLADFGMAKILTGNSYELSLKGSPYWMAPEVMKATTKNESNPDLVMAIDIWSLGCTIIEMLTGKPPWGEFEGPSAMFKVLQQSPPIPETLSSVGKDFLQQCFQRDPADRPSAEMLLKHAFVQNLHDQDLLVHPPIGDPGSRDNSPSPSDTTKNRRHSMPSSMSARTFNKIQKLTSDTSQQNTTEESNHIIPYRHSQVPEVNILQSSFKPDTLNYMSVANNSNIPLTVMRMITHL
ncbi:Protein kinase domain [Sesbania bispinosa]|nr:Protein kinase domain [Sesbania bispinosa]